MSQHLHQKTEYCWCCGNIATSKCGHCSMPICSECARLYNGLCDICGEEKSLAETGVSLGIGMDYEYAKEDNYLLDV